jgi:hypothetical protein
MMTFAFDEKVYEEARRARTKEAATGNESFSELSPLNFIDMSDWDNEPLPEYEWSVPGLIPLHQTAIFSGDGGLGKSTMGLQLVAAHVLGRAWLQFPSHDQHSSLTLRTPPRLCKSGYADVNCGALLHDGPPMLSGPYHSCVPKALVCWTRAKAKKHH